MPNQVQVRPARAEDKAPIVAFCQNTFSWGDYIAHAWDGWLADPKGRLFVALVDQRPVGIAHVGLLDQSTAWMEGMRVNPDYRRRGIANALDAGACEFARERGCSIARLVTSVKNTAAQSLLAASGYRRTAQFNEWQSEPRRGDFSNWRVATEKDIAAILVRWQKSEICTASCTVVPNRHWRWTVLDAARLADQIQAGEVRVTSRGLALLPAFDESDWNGLSIHALAGDAADLFALALAARGEAEHRGYAHVEATVVDYAPLNSVLERAGYKTTSGMFLYEQAL